MKKYRSSSRALSLVPFFLCACTLSPQDRVVRHFGSDPWEEAFTGQASSWETQALPELVALAAVPLLRMNDHSLQSRLAGHKFASESTGVTVSHLLGFAPFVPAVYGGLKGDELAMLETVAEATALSSATTHLIKQIRGRDRPDHSNDKSFPSSAATEAFTGATLTARWLADQGDSWEYKLGYGLYLPALFVAKSRIEHGKHFPSDVAAGAFIGMFAANTIYNLHFGDRESGRGGIFPRSWTDRVSLEPHFSEDGSGFTLSFRF